MNFRAPSSHSSFQRSPGQKQQHYRTTTPHMSNRSPQFQQRSPGHGPRWGAPSPRGPGHFPSTHQSDFGYSSPNPRPRYTNSGNNLFRTPQPVFNYRNSPPSNRSWSCDKNFGQNFTRPSPKRLQMKSPRYDPNVNPGGSHNIELYYHSSMLDDPWRYMLPIPVAQTPSATT